MDIIESPDGIRYSKSAYEAGRAEAREALSRGVLALQRREPNDPWRGDFVEILSRDYQIAYHISTGCIVSDRGIGRDRGFNEVMETAIESRFGIEVFKTAERKARQQFEERFPQ